eukprot:4414086-Karenia_brevis.AAC.1
MMHGGVGDGAEIMIGVMTMAGVAIGQVIGQANGLLRKLRLRNQNLPPPQRLPARLVPVVPVAPPLLQLSRLLCKHQELTLPEPKRARLIRVLVTDQNQNRETILCLVC